jgi:ribosome-binding factor A
MRYLPKLVFESDDLFDQGEKIEQLLRSPRVARDLLASKGFEG